MAADFPYALVLIDLYPCHRLLQMESQAVAYQYPEPRHADVAGWIQICHRQR